MGYEIQKILTAILLVFLVVFGIGKVSNLIFKNESNVVAYKVEAPEGSSVQASTETATDISALLALGSVEHGKNVFKKCAACHSINKGGKNKIGPKLWSVMFRPVGAVTDYKYSKALSEYKKNWSWEEMNGFLLKPSAWIKGNKMGFAGLKKDEDRASILLYLNQNSDDPKPLP
tara:strand:+ start:422 stop:943 length:522 start_codon:yes stop_codon:yes gene_type:complete